MKLIGNYDHAKKVGQARQESMLKRAEASRGETKEDVTNLASNIDTSTSRGTSSEAGLVPNQDTTSHDDLRVKLLQSPFLCKRDVDMNDVEPWT